MWTVRMSMGMNIPKRAIICPLQITPQQKPTIQ